MGQRKRPGKVAGQPARPEGKPAADSKVLEVDLGPETRVKAECEKALISLRRGNSTKAVKIIKEAIVRYPDVALGHRVNGHIHLKLANLIEDSTTKQRNFRTALEEAKRASVLSPRSVEYAHFYAQLLFEVANDGKGYDEVVKECERALSVEEPIDPAKESLQDEGQQDLPTADARISHMQSELRSMVQKANIASLSTWMKTFGNGNGEEKLRFLQVSGPGTLVRKLAEDPMEQRVAQPKRPHEVKKSVKTAEERRQEIEVRVAAARLLQHRQGRSGTGFGSGDGDEGEGGSGRRRGGDRKRKDSYGRGRNVRLSPTEERIERVKPYWKGCTAEEKARLLELSIADLQANLTPHNPSAKASEALEAFNEALAFAQDRKTWRFWACCQCSEKFTEQQEHIHHVMSAHIGKLTAKQQKMLPQEIDQDWFELIQEEDVKPVNAPAALKILMETAQTVPLEEAAAADATARSSESETEGSHGSMSSRSSSSSLEQFVDPVFSPMDEGASGQSLITLGGDEEKVEEHASEKQPEHEGHVCNGECQRRNLLRAVESPPSLPLVDGTGADDEERTKLLNNVHGIFRSMMSVSIPIGDPVLKVVQYAVDEMQNVIPESDVHYEFNLSPLYVRFLNPAQLKNILKYLKDLAHQLRVEKLLPDPKPEPTREEPMEEDIIQDRLLLNEEFTLIHLDERVLKEVDPNAPSLLEKPLEGKDTGKGEETGKVESEAGCQAEERKGANAESDESKKGSEATGEDDVGKEGVLIRGEVEDNGVKTKEGDCKEVLEGEVRERMESDGLDMIGKGKGGVLEKGKQDSELEIGSEGKKETGEAQQRKETKIIILGDLELSQERRRQLLEKQQLEDASLRRPLPLMRVKDGVTASHSDLQLSWIFGKMDYELQPSAWKQLREDMASKGKDLCEGLKKEIAVIQSLCDKKRDQVDYEEGLNLVEKLCAAEASKRGQHGGERSFEVMQARLLELTESGSNSRAKKAESEALAAVMIEFQKSWNQVRRFTYPESLTSSAGRSGSDSDEEDEDQWKLNTLFSRCREVASAEQSQSDTKLFRAMDTLTKQEAQLNAASVFDYRAVVLPLVKAFLQNRLEGAVEKDAQQKSDAAQEKFLAELANDEKAKPVEVKAGREKLRDKKKAKDGKKGPKDPKRQGPNGVSHADSNGDAEHLSLLYELDEDVEEEEETWEAEEDVEARQRDEAEARRAAELEAEERQLAQALEKQRRAEEQAKLTRLAQRGALESVESIDAADMAYLRELEMARKESLAESRGTEGAEGWKEANGTPVEEGEKKEREEANGWTEEKVSEDQMDKPDQNSGLSASSPGWQEKAGWQPQPKQDVAQMSRKTAAGPDSRAGAQAQPDRQPLRQVVPPEHGQVPAGEPGREATQPRQPHQDAPRGMNGAPPRQNWTPHRVGTRGPSPSSQGQPMANGQHWHGGPGARGSGPKPQPSTPDQRPGLAKAPAGQPRGQGGLSQQSGEGKTAMQMPIKVTPVHPRLHQQQQQQQQLQQQQQQQQEQQPGPHSSSPATGEEEVVLQGNGGREGMPYRDGPGGRPRGPRGGKGRRRSERERGRGNLHGHIGEGESEAGLGSEGTSWEGQAGLPRAQNGEVAEVPEPAAPALEFEAATRLAGQEVAQAPVGLGVVLDPRVDPRVVHGAGAPHHGPPAGEASRHGSQGHRHPEEDVDMASLIRALIPSANGSQPAAASPAAVPLLNRFPMPVFQHPPVANGNEPPMMNGGTAPGIRPVNGAAGPLAMPPAVPRAASPMAAANGGPHPTMRPALVNVPVAVPGPAPGGQQGRSPVVPPSTGAATSPAPQTWAAMAAQRRERPAAPQPEKPSLAMPAAQASHHPTGSWERGAPILRTPVSGEATSEEEEEARAAPLRLPAAQEAEEDDVQFQADLEQAMRQSLSEVKRDPRQRSSPVNGGHLRPNGASARNTSENLRSGPAEAARPGGPSLPMASSTSSPAVAVADGAPEPEANEPAGKGAVVDEAGKGLRNEVGQYNCFLNVVIQSLWHLQEFREAMLAEEAGQHSHQGEPCVVCALRDIFLSLSASGEERGASVEPVAPTPLRLALSAMYSETEFFQESEMNDASEVLAVIFDCLHKAFVQSGSSVDKDGESNGSANGIGEWDCVRDAKQGPCMAHALFGLDIAEQMNCTSCGMESRHLKYTTFFHNINASALRMAKIANPGCNLAELMNVVDQNHQLPCDPESNGCGKQNYIHHILRAAPPVFTTVLGWQNGQESEEDISLTVDAINTELSVDKIYRGLSEQPIVRLVSVVCYYGQHYHCFAYNRELCQWVMFDDSTVKVVGGWDEVTKTCRKGHLQPQVLFYEAAR